MSEPVSKAIMISPTKKKTMHKIDEEIISFKTINKNMGEYQEAIKEYEAEELQKKDILAGMDSLVKKMLKSNIIQYIHLYSNDGCVRHPGGRIRSKTD